MKTWKKTLVLALVCTAISLLATLIITVYRRVKMLSGFKLKELLRELYPEHEWEHTGLNIHLTGIACMVWYPESFAYVQGETEEQVKAAMYERMPGLKCQKLKLIFKPVAEFDLHKAGGCCSKSQA